MLATVAIRSRSSTPKLRSWGPRRSPSGCAAAIRAWLAWSSSAISRRRRRSRWSARRADLRCDQAGLRPEHAILIVGGHVSALPDRTLREEPVDYVCNGEGPVTIVQELLDGFARGATQEILREGRGPRLVGSRARFVTIASRVALIKDLGYGSDTATCGTCLPMRSIARTTGSASAISRAAQPYASIYTSLGCPYSCVFCCINAPFGVNRYRMRTPELVVAEIDHLSTPTA